MFDVQNITFGNVYLPSGNDPLVRSNRENYVAEILPSLLVNTRENGCIGGDWNCVTENIDATKNASNKKSPCLKRLLKTFSWLDSFRSLYPNDHVFSRHYDTTLHGEGATRIDRMYHYGDLEIISAEYVGVAFSDHLSLVFTIKVPQQLSGLLCPKSKPLFKANPDVIRDKIFQARLKDSFALWSEIKEYGIDILIWWELVVKTGIKKLLIERGKEMAKVRRGELNLLLLQQSYLVRTMAKTG